MKIVAKMTIASRKFPIGPAAPPRRGGGARLREEAAPPLVGVHGRDGVRVGNAGDILVAEEFDVTAERNGRDLPAGAGPVVEPDELGPESDRKDQHLDTAPARDQEMAELMHEDDDRQNEQKRQDDADHDMP